ncbi:MAG: hypothetical protein HY683_06455 [Chloroflexi bacterium]|nr:hypothetical protein [Chloroflexota bacterium]
MTGAYTPAYREGLRCPVCREPLTVRLARGRKSGKPFVMLLCAADGCHFRAFITYQPYVSEVLAHLEGREGHPPSAADPDVIPPPSAGSGAHLERGTRP